MRDSKRHCFPEKVAKPLFRQLVAAVGHMHERRILHRDVKPQNIIVAPDLSTLHLTDFNIARALTSAASLTPTGTWEYSAPEVMRGESPSEAQDIWGVGLCLCMMVAGNVLKPSTYFSASIDVPDQNQITTCLEGWEGISQPCKHVANCCLALDWHARPAAIIILRMEWLNSPPQKRTRSIDSSKSPGSLRQWHRSRRWGSDAHMYVWEPQAVVVL